MILFVARRKVVLQSLALILAKFRHRNLDTDSIVFIASSRTQDLSLPALIQPFSSSSFHIFSFSLSSIQ